MTIECRTVIHTWKPHEEGYLVACDKNDPDAVRWDVTYPGMPYSSINVQFKSLAEAQSFCYVCINIFNAGKVAAKQELKTWLEKKDE